MDFKEKSLKEVKDYWNYRPCNVRHSPKQVGTREYFEEVNHRKLFVEPHIRGFADFPQWKDKKVLVIGCGIGTGAIHFALSGAQVTAVDLSEKSLELAKKHAECYGVTIKFIQADAENLEEYLVPEQFDLVWSFGVIHHTPNPENVLDQLRKYMGPDSEMRIMLYHKFCWKVLWILISYGGLRFWKLDELIARHSEAQTGCPVTYSYTKKQAEKLLNDCGYEVTDIQVEHIFPYCIMEYKKYEYKKVWYFRWMPEEWFNWFEKKLGWHLCITAKIRQ